MRTYCLGVFFIILGTALADSPSIVPTLSLTITGMTILAMGAKLCAGLDY